MKNLKFTKTHLGLDNSIKNYWRKANEALKLVKQRICLIIV
jgi:hypothetical protein